MSKFWTSALFLLLTPLFFAQVASADTIFSFGYSDTAGNVATATLSAVDLGGGSYLANSGTLTVTGGADVGLYYLLAVAGLPSNGGGAVYSPSGKFYFDDMLLIGTSPFLDGAGLLFVGNGLEINMWANGPNNFSLYSWNGSTYNVAVDGGTDSEPTPVTSAPEPSSLALLGLVGVCGVCLRFRQRKHAATA